MSNDTTNQAKQTEHAEPKHFVQTASVMDDSGTNKVAGFMATKAEEKQYNDGMAKLAEAWG